MPILTYKNKKEMEQYIKRLEGDLRVIQSAKTYKIWQMYCFVRKLITQVVISFIKKIASFLYLKKTRGITHLSNLPASTSITDTSIVIPTYNGAKTLPYVLKAISSQTNLGTPEIIIIDSGSTDETLKIAKNYKCQIILIKKSQFNHGLTRNLGARHAKGKYIIFTVQDAVPCNNKTYSNLLSLLIYNEKIVAVSTRQISYPDADLFAKWQVINHNVSLKLDHSNFISTLTPEIKFYKLPFLEKRKISLLDDVCSTYKKKEFFKIGGFKKFDFAEDIDFSIRALRKGYSIGFTGQSGIIHSHTRSASYFLKRYYLDNKVVLALFKEKYRTQYKTLNQVFLSSVNTYSFIIRLFTIMSKINSIPDCQTSIKILESKRIRKIELKSELLTALIEISRKLGFYFLINRVSKKPDFIFFEQFRQIFNNASKSMNLSKYQNDEIKQFAEKLFTIVIGNQLVALTMDPRNKERHKIEKQLNLVLSDNV